VPRSICAALAASTKAAELDGRHAFTLLGCLRLGLTEGMFSKAVLDILLKPVTLEAPSGTAEKTPVARSSDPTRSFATCAATALQWLQSC